MLTAFLSSVLLNLLLKFFKMMINKPEENVSRFLKEEKVEEIKSILEK